MWTLLASALKHYLIFSRVSRAERTGSAEREKKLSDVTAEALNLLAGVKGASWISHDLVNRLRYSPRAASSHTRRTAAVARRHFSPAQICESLLLRSWCWWWFAASSIHSATRLKLGPELSRGRGAANGDRNGEPKRAGGKFENAACDVKLLRKRDYVWANVGSEGTRSGKNGKNAGNRWRRGERGRRRVRNNRIALTERHCGHWFFIVAQCN